MYALLLTNTDYRMLVIDIAYCRIQNYLRLCIRACNLKLHGPQNTKFSHILLISFKSKLQVYESCTFWRLNISEQNHRKSISSSLALLYAEPCSLMSPKIFLQRCWLWLAECNIHRQYQYEYDRIISCTSELVGQDRPSFP